MPNSHNSSLETDVVILGGGIMGIATSFFLLQRFGMKSVVLERGKVGAQASGINFGNVRRQGRKIEQLDLANHSMEQWLRLKELTGGNSEFQRSGHLRLAHSPEDMGVLERYYNDSKDAGLNLELMGRNSLRERFPFVSTTVHGGSFSPLDGTANPRLLTPLVARQIRAMGGQIHEDCPVLDCLRVNGRYELETSVGKFASQIVVNTLGAWGANFAEKFGDVTPLHPMGPQLLVTEPLPFKISPAIGSVSGGIYLRQVARGNIVFGNSVHTAIQLDPPRSRSSQSEIVRMLRDVTKITPEIAGKGIIRSWSGVEGYFDDGLPVMEESRGNPGLFHAFGFSGHGFQLGLGVGSALAQLIATGHAPVNMEPYQSERFRFNQSSEAHH